MGELVFLAGLDNGSGGIFTGPDPIADSVIFIGDSLFGSNVTRFNLVPGGESFGNMDINDLGQIAFHYELADGRQGIAVANPVPEPGIAASLVLAMLLLGAMHRSSFGGWKMLQTACFFTRGSLRCLPLLAALAVPSARQAHAAAYTFTNIAAANGIFAKAQNNLEGIGTAPLSINNAEMVAFRSFLDDGGTGVFVGNGGPVQSIALSSDPVFFGVGGASINSGGTVAFRGRLESGVLGVFTSNGRQLATFALNTEPTFSNFLDPVINDAGTVAFHVQFIDGSRGILSRNGGSTTTIAAASDANFSGVATNISINSSGTVGFKAFLKNGQGGYFASNGGAPTTIFLGNLLPDGVAINDTGNVAFNFSGAVYVGNGTSLAVIADTSGPFIGFGQYSSINNLGDVVFLAGLDSGGGGLFTGPDPVADKVIRIGDSLFGSTLVSTSLATVGEIFGNVDINDAGQVAFHYELASGLQGIAVATPVPEPGVMASLAYWGVVMGFMRCRFSKNQQTT